MWSHICDRHKCILLAHFNVRIWIVKTSTVLQLTSAVFVLHAEHWKTTHLATPTNQTHHLTPQLHHPPRCSPRSKGCVRRRVGRIHAAFAPQSCRTHGNRVPNYVSRGSVCPGEKPARAIRRNECDGSRARRGGDERWCRRRHRRVRDAVMRPGGRADCHGPACCGIC